jgi:hypothetical protein
MQNGKDAKCNFERKLNRKSLRMGSRIEKKKKKYFSTTCGSGGVNCWVNCSKDFRRQGPSSVREITGNYSLYSKEWIWRMNKNSFAPSSFIVTNMRGT